MSNDQVIGILMGLFIGIVSSVLIASVVISKEVTRVQQQAIDSGYALYCPKDGEFAWKGECDE